jgi:hypothetical protein
MCSRRRRARIMPKSTHNSGWPWTDSDIGQLRQLARENTPTQVIGLKLGRTENVYQRASGERVSLRPTNQRPYGRRGR